MNLFFRLLVLVLRNALFKRPLGYLDEAVLNHRVWITDQDAFLHMTNSRYNSFCDLACLDLMTRIGVLGPMRRAGFTPIMVYRGATLHRMLKFPDAFQIRTRITAWDGPYVCFQHDFTRGDEICAVAISLGRTLGRGREKPTIQAVMDAIGQGDTPTSPEMSDFCRAKIAELEAAREERRRKRAAQISF